MLYILLLFFGMPLLVLGIVLVIYYRKPGRRTPTPHQDHLTPGQEEVIERMGLRRGPGPSNLP